MVTDTDISQGESLDSTVKPVDNRQSLLQTDQRTVTMLQKDISPGNIYNGTSQIIRIAIFLSLIKEQLCVFQIKQIISSFIIQVAQSLIHFDLIKEIACAGSHALTLLEQADGLIGIVARLPVTAL